MASALLVLRATTHLVVATDAQGRTLQRSTKYLTALARGIWVMSDKWVMDSAKAGGWLPEPPYEARNRHSHAPTLPPGQLIAEERSRPAIAAN